MVAMKATEVDRIIVAKWRIKESEATRILKMLPDLAEKTRDESGNISYTIYQSETDPRRRDTRRPGSERELTSWR